MRCTQTDILFDHQFSVDDFSLSYILGLMPRKIPQQKKLKKKLNEVGSTNTSNPDLVKQNHKKLARVLNKQGNACRGTVLI